MRSDVRPVIEKFYEKFQIVPNGCWEWTGGKNKKGYGVIWLWGLVYKAHRCSYLFHIGPIPQGVCVCHNCDNPGCVRPDHLFLGKPKDNTADMFRKHRNNGQVGKFSVKLNEHDAREIRKQYLSIPIIGCRKKMGSVSKIANHFGISNQTVQKIGQNKAWNHLLHKE